MRWRKEIGSVAFAISQRSDTTRMKYYGGRGSAIGTVKEMEWSSYANSFLRMKISWCQIVSWSVSSTIT